MVRQSRISSLVASCNSAQIPHLSRLHTPEPHGRRSTVAESRAFVRTLSDLPGKQLSTAFLVCESLLQERPSISWTFNNITSSSPCWCMKSRHVTATSKNSHVRCLVQVMAEMFSQSSHYPSVILGKRSRWPIRVTAAS